MPPSSADADNRVARIIQALVRNGQLQSVEGVHRVYLVAVPFAETIQTTDEQIVQEAHPSAAFSFLTAMAYHGFTDQVPDRLFVTSFGRPDGRRLPLGTTPEDWIDTALPAPSFPRRVRAVTVDWMRSLPKGDFGITIGLSAGLPIYVTDPERTLLDGLRAPERCKGISLVLRAWRIATERLDIERIVDYTKRLNSPVMRQRVGFLLEELALTHPILKEWRRSLQRGGSIKLVASAPYAPTFSERWNLSINVPPHVIEELHGE